MSSIVEPITRASSRRATTIRSAVLVVALIVVVGLGWISQHPKETVATFCTAEGLIGNDGKTYARSSAHGCDFVDEDGHPLPTDRDDTPIAPS